MSSDAFDPSDFDDIFDEPEPSPAPVAVVEPPPPEPGPVVVDDAPAPRLVISAQARQRLTGEELWDLDLEVSLLGAMLLDADSAAIAVTELVPDDFYRIHHARVFESMLAVHQQGTEIDAPALRHHLLDRGMLATIGGAEFLGRALASASSVVTTRDYVQVIARLAEARREERAIEELVTAETGAQRERARERLRAALDPKVPGRSARVPSFAMTDAVTLDELDLPEIEGIVSQDLIYRGGVTFMVAPYKVGKSMATLGLCIDVATGRAESPHGASWLGLDVLASGVVHYYSAEGGLRLVRKRLRKMDPYCTPGLERLRLRAERPLPRIDDPSHLDAVFAAAEADHAVLLVFDPLGRFWSMEDESDARLLRDLVEGIQLRAAAAYGGRGIAVLIVHHDSKTAGEEGTRASGGRGSGKIADDADGLINLKTTKIEGVVERVAISRWDESPAPQRFELCPDTLRFLEASEEVSDASRARGAALPKHSDEDFLRALGKAVSPVTVAEWAEIAEVSKRTLERRIGSLVFESGSLLEVVPGARGSKRYRLSSEARELLR